MRVATLTGRKTLLFQSRSPSRVNFFRLGMFIGFEGIGVCSYYGVLIGYWSHRLAASKSALKAIVVNRISDGLMVYYYGVLFGDGGILVH